VGGRLKKRSAFGLILPHAFQRAPCNPQITPKANTLLRAAWTVVRDWLSRANTNSPCPLPTFTYADRDHDRVDHVEQCWWCQPVWSSGQALGWSADDVGSTPRFGSPFSSKLVVCGHCLVALTLKINGTLNWLSPLPM